MALKSGRYVLGPDDGELLVKTRREGAASRVGHDVTLRAARWSATMSVDARAPGRSSVQADIDAGSLVVRDASGGALALTDSQRQEIERNTREKVLHSDKHHTITFASTAVSGDNSRASVTGDLTINGVTRQTTLDVRVKTPAGLLRMSGATTVVQTDFGIKPYSALLGALRVRDLVEVIVDVQLPQSPAR
jgi:polyisoprenoid-binding protein YceI